MQDAVRILRRHITTDITSRRIHELALQRWLNKKFVLAEGYPIPVVFAEPSEAFSEFTALWRNAENNPYKYLYDLKDPDGNPVYQTSPAAPHYPIVTVSRGALDYRQWDSYGTRNYRPAFYRTTSSDVETKDIGTAVKRKMPTAWNYTFQITFQCTSMQTYAFLEHKLEDAFTWAQSAPQTYIPVRYPYKYGVSMRRLALAGAIDDISPNAGESDQKQYWIGFSIVIEGLHHDYSEQQLPALWSTALNVETATPGVVDELYSQETDLRNSNNNVMFKASSDLPK